MTTMTEGELRKVRIINYEVKASADFTCQLCGKASNTLAVDIVAELAEGEDPARACICLPCFESERHVERPGQWRAAELQRAEEKKAPPKKK